MSKNQTSLLKAFGNLWGRKTPRKASNNESMTTNQEIRCHRFVVIRRASTFPDTLLEVVRLEGDYTLVGQSWQLRD